jgi:RNA polymerase sigma-70 factor (ECF subfamily)
MRAYNRLSSLDVSRGGFGRWMTRIVTNTGLNARKAQRVRAAEPMHLVSNLVSPEPQPDQAAEHEEIRRRFRLALSDLSACQRVIVTLYEVEGVPTADIAEQLGMKPETVRWHLHRARKILRRTLSPLREAGDAHDDP